MNSIYLYNQACGDCSVQVTKAYSTSFFSAIRLLGRKLQKPVCAIYGMVRLADEIVDTFHEHDKCRLLKDFRSDTFKAIENGISLNPILQNFQRTVREFNIETSLISAFFQSMELDLSKKEYLNREEYTEYIYGSAEVVGLMCLYVFCEGDKKRFDALQPYAKALGAAFQKVNFLRDLQSDLEDLSRSYFPGFEKGSFTTQKKHEIEKDIEHDFELAYRGIKQLPLSARFGVYVAYRYYLALFKKLKKANTEAILDKRIRIPNHIKFAIVLKAGLRSQLNMI